MEELGKIDFRLIDSLSELNLNSLIFEFNFTQGKKTFFILRKISLLQLKSHEIFGGNNLLK